MSGSTGTESIKSRKDFLIFLNSYVEILNKFEYFKDSDVSGSFISDKNKQVFGDMDLIVLSVSNKTKKEIKKELIEFINTQPKNTFLEFSSEKYKGKKTLNTGEIITVRYYDSVLNYSCQVDNIIALSEDEFNFKRWFLNIEATKQGLLLGFIKTILLEEDYIKIFNELNIPEFITVYDNLLTNQELEFNISSVELQLRKITYNSNTDLKNNDVEILWKSQTLIEVLDLLSFLPFNILNPYITFETLVSTIKTLYFMSPRTIPRIKGLFKSMISIKSGEIGTIKGNNKQYALDLIDSI